MGSQGAQDQFEGKKQRPAPEAPAAEKFQLAD